MFWVIGSIVLLVALLIPILAIVLDAPALRNFLERRSGAEGPHHLKALADRVSRLEDDLDDLSQSLQALREETQFLQQLLENPEQRPAPKSLTPPKP